jgi:RNA polymerase sigma-70 factor (ECF subfamily)
MLTIARNLAIGELRKRRSRQQLQERMIRMEWDHAAILPMGDDTREQVRLALGALPEEQRAAIVLKEYNGLEYRDVARVLGCTEQAARARTYRARCTMRELLREWWESTRE